ncbi:MAG: hypothetical protein WDM89_17245 [Rhizomicrobium sp.]
MAFGATALLAAMTTTSFGATSPHKDKLQDHLFFLRAGELRGWVQHHEPDSGQQRDAIWCSCGRRRIWRWRDFCARAAGRPGWIYQRLYSFCQIAACPDGQYVSGRLVADGEGNLYGVTSQGGAHGAGVAFELISDTLHDHWDVSDHL